MVVFAAFLLPLIGDGSWALQPPPDMAALGLFLVSLVCALILACSFTMVMHVVLVWTISGEGLNRILPSVVNVFSGMIVPLPLFPAWLQPFLNLQPFRGLVDVPFRIYSGNIQAADAAPEILLQLGWAMVFIVVGRWMLARSMSRMVVQGG